MTDSPQTTYRVIWRNEMIGYAHTPTEASLICDIAGVPYEIAGSPRSGVELIDAPGTGPVWRPKFGVV